MHQLFSVLHFKLYSQKKKETMGWNEVDNSYNIQHINMKFKREKKEEIWLSPMTKAPTPTEKSKKQRDNTKKKRHQKLSDPHFSSSQFTWYHVRHFYLFMQTSFDSSAAEPQYAKIDFL